MSLSAVIFDIDGTLADTEEAHRQAFNDAFRAQGLAWEWGPGLYRELLAVAGGRERVRHFAARHDPAALARPDPGGWIAALHADKTRRFTDRLAQGQVAPRPGIARLIDELHRTGVALAIATTTSRVNVEALLRGCLGLRPEAFAVIGAGEQVAAKKPDPEVYRWVVERLGVPAARCLAIEDSANGVHAALGAGVPVLVTQSTWSEGENFSGALAVLSDLGEPWAPFRLIRGADPGQGWVDLALLERWHG